MRPPNGQFPALAIYLDDPPPPTGKDQHLTCRKRACNLSDGSPALSNDFVFFRGDEHGKDVPALEQSLACGTGQQGAVRRLLQQPDVRILNKPISTLAKVPERTRTSHALVAVTPPCSDTRAIT
jgi:hypothetical protein